MRRDDAEFSRGLSRRNVVSYPAKNLQSLKSFDGRYLRFSVLPLKMQPKLQLGPLKWCEGYFRDSRHGDNPRLLNVHCRAEDDALVVLRHVKPFDEIRCMIVTQFRT